MQAPRKRAEHPVELDRTETIAWREILWSNGHRIRFNTFRNYADAPLTRRERLERERTRRARKIARRAKGRRINQLLGDHGLGPDTIRFSW